MEISILCVFISFLLIMVSKAPLVIAMAKSSGGYNNRQPRDQQSSLTGWGARALAGHQNAFESFVGFAPAMIFAHMMQVDSDLSGLLGIFFVSSRIIYHVLYLLDWHVLRSTVWGIGYGIIVWLFILAIF